MRRQVAAMLCLLCMCTYAEEKAEPTHKLSKVEVTAERERGYTNRLERNLVKRPHTESPGLATSTTVVGRTEIEMTGAYSIVDAMEYIPGAWIERRGRKVKEFFSVRGQRYPYPTYLIDNAWFREFEETNYFFNAADVDRIEIVRSSNTLLHGPGGMTGVINIIPRRYLEPETTLQTSYGSDNTFRTQLSHGDGTDDFDYALGLGYHHTDGPDDENAGENITNFYNRMAFKPSDELTMSLSSFIIYGDREMQLAEPPATNTLQTREDSFDPMKIYAFILKTEYKPSDDASTDLTFNYANRRFWGHRDAATEWFEEDYEFGADVLQTMKLTPENTLRFGLMANHWRSPTGKRFYVGRPGELTTYSGVIVDEHDFGPLDVDFGYRCSRTYIDEFGGFNIEGTAGSLKTVRVEDEWEDPLHTVSFGAAYDLGGGVSLHSSLMYGELAAKPGMLDVNFEEPDTERRTKGDLGILLKQKGWGEMTLTGFYVYQDDAALLTNNVVTVGGEDYALYESADRKSYGVELDIRSERFAGGFMMFANATVTRTKRTVNGDWTLDKEVPEYIVNGGASYLVGPMEFICLVKHVSSYENTRFLPGGSDPAPLGDFIDTNLKAVYSLGEGEQNDIFVAVNNVGDKKYSTVNGYPDEGRQYQVGVTLRF